MATVDLGLHLVERIYSRKTASELGQYILAGSVRQKQSVYAQALVRPQEPGSPFYDLERWMTNNLHRPVTIARMAADNGMSLRSFHRHFTAQLGMSPNKYLQLKRIETAKELLRNERLGMEQILDRIGLMDITSFRKVFAREIGMSPAEFRRRVRQA
jgi:transcriptional regulator GlxA family with amidase domain